MQASFILPNSMLDKLQFQETLADTCNEPWGVLQDRGGSGGLAIHVKTKGRKRSLRVYQELHLPPRAIRGTCSQAVSSSANFVATPQTRRPVWGAMVSDRHRSHTEDGAHRPMLAWRMCAQARSDDAMSYSA